MFGHRREKPRFQVDVSSPSRRGVSTATKRRAAPVTVNLGARRKKRRFHVGPPDTARWKAPSLRSAIQSAGWVRWVRQRAAPTLAHRRQLRRLEMIGGGLLLALAVIASSLLMIPETRNALFPPQKPTAEEAAGTAVGSYNLSGHALHYGVERPYTTLQPHASSGAPAPAIQAQAAFLFDPQHGWILYQKNADAPYPAASLTKVMTLLLAIDSGDLSQTVTVGSDAAALVNSNNSYMGLSAGEQLTMRDLLYGLIVAGGNDAALAIADAVGGNEATFVLMMNQRAQQLGLTQTHFVTPDGVDDGDVTSASDMAKLSAIVMQRPGVQQITSVYSYSIPQTATHKSFNLQGSNDLLPGGASPYAGADGVKTGYTASAQSCIAFSAHVNGRFLVGVILGDSSAQARAADAHALLDWGFAQN